MRTFKRKSELIEMLSTPLRGTMSVRPNCLTYQVKVNGAVAYVKLHDGAQLVYLPYQTLHAMLRLIWCSFNYQYTFHIYNVDDLLSRSELPICYLTIDNANVSL